MNAPGTPRLPMMWKPPCTQKKKRMHAQVVHHNRNQLLVRCAGAGEPLAVSPGLFLAMSSAASTATARQTYRPSTEPTHEPSLRP